MRMLWQVWVHLFSSQKKNAIQKRLINMKMFDLDQLNQKVKGPELVNQYQSSGAWVLDQIYQTEI